MNTRRFMIVLIPLFCLTLLAFNVEAEALVTRDEDKDTSIWGGADYITEVEVRLNDSIINTVTGDADYIFDSELNWFETSDNNWEVTLNFDVSPNTMTSVLSTPLMLGDKLATINSVYSYEGQKAITLDNLSSFLLDINDIPVYDLHGRTRKTERFSVGNTYTMTVELERLGGMVRGAQFKLGRNSFEYSVVSYQNWIDNTQTLENMQIDSANGGMLKLDSDNGAPAGGTWWNEDWNYRIPITINGGRPDNYQIRINLDLQDNLNSNARTDFGDLRFTESDHATELEYWVEGRGTGDNARIWIRALDNEENTIYCYYGNAGADNGNTAENVWGYSADFFENTGWTEVEDGTAHSNIYNNEGRLYFWDYAYDEEAYVYATERGRESWTMDFRIEITDDTGGAGWAGTGASNEIDDLRNCDEGAYIMFYGANGDLYSLGNSGGSYFLDDGLWNWTEDTTYNVTLRKVGTDNMGVFVWDDNNRSRGDELLDFNHTAGIEPDLMPYVFAISTFNAGAVGAQLDGWVTNVTIRDYVYPEPTTSVSGAEEEAPTGSQTHENQGEWFSVRWDLGELSVVENLYLHVGQDARDIYSLGATTINPVGITYKDDDDAWFIVNSDNGSVSRYDENWDIYSSIDLSHTENTGAGIGFDDLQSFLIVNPDNDVIDNYFTTSFIHTNFWDLSGWSTNIRDITWRNNQWYMLSSDGRIRILNKDMGGTPTDFTLDFVDNDNTANALTWSENYWYVAFTGGFGGSPEQTYDRIRRFDATWNDLGWWKSTGGYDGHMTGLYHDNDNLYMVGTQTDNVYVFYEGDESSDNIYAMIRVSTDNDATMEENSGWILVPDNAILFTADFGISDGYNYELGFRMVTDNFSYTPRVSAFSLFTDYSRIWTYGDNWSENWTVLGWTWYFTDAWNDRWIVYGAVAEPLFPIDSLIVDVLVPMFFLFIPALILMKEHGMMGFIIGLIIGIAMCAVVYSFSVGVMVLLIVGIIYIVMRRNG